MNSSDLAPVDQKPEDLVEPVVAPADAALSVAPVAVPDAPSAPAMNGFPAAALWQDQDGMLRDMWLQNKTPQEISEALNRSVPAVMTRAARLGLPRRSAPGRKPGRRPMEAREGQGYTPVQRNTARPAPREYSTVPVQTSLRVCLMCLTKFESAGRQNRICSSCKGSSEYESASALPELHVPV